MEDLTTLELEAVATVEEYSSATATALTDAYNWFHEAVIIFVIALILNLAIKYILQYFHHHFEKQKTLWKDSFVKALSIPLTTYIWIVAAIKAFDTITQNMFQESWIPDRQMFQGVAAIVCLAWFLLRWKGYVKRNLQDKSRRHKIPFEYSKIDVVDKLTTVIILFFTALFILEITGRSLTTLIAFGGVGGLAIAFASQEIISNFFGGLMIYLTHPFTVGDWIILPEKDIEGHVEEIGWYMTRIRTFEKRPIYIPNSIFTKMVVVNPSRMSHRRFKEDIGIRYEDIGKVKAVIADIQKMLDKHPDIDHSEKSSVYMDAFGTYSIDISVVAFTMQIDSQGFAETKEHILLAIAQILTKHGAEFASPPIFVEPGKK